MDEQVFLQKSNSPAPKPEPEPKKKRRISKFLLRVIALAVVLAAALVLVLLVVFRDRLNMDSIKRWFHYRSLTISDNGRAESFAYDGDLNCAFAVLDGDLLVCSGNAVSLYSGSGTRYIHEQVNMENPVVNTNGTLAVV